MRGKSGIVGQALVLTVVLAACSSPEGVPYPLNFKKVTVGSKAEKPITLKNEGALTYLKITVSNQIGSGFKKGVDKCTGHTFPTFSECISVGVIFEPPAKASYEAYLNVEYEELFAGIFTAVEVDNIIGEGA